MSTKSNTVQIIFDVLHEGVRKGVMQLSENSPEIKGNIISIDGKEVVNFGSCSYLGLEHDARLKEGAKIAIDNFGTQFSSSRAYISLGLYKELEALLAKVFNDNPVVVTPTTTLGHISTIPVLVEDGDAIILDHQVHHSVQTAVSLLKSKKVHIEMIRHNNMNMLEEKIRELKPKSGKIWYMADGVYSMYGDTCPMPELLNLLNTEEQFRLYADDAHGMSCFGSHGAGFVMSQLEQLHPHMILATSFAKAFATGGAAMIFPDRKLAERVRTAGTGLVTSGPLQPANLGAAIASSYIHLSNEIYQLQDELSEKIKFTNLLLKNYGLPLISDSKAAIFFVGVSLPRLGYKLVEKMMKRGFYVNLGIFPGVPIKNTGIRFTITRLHSYRQISEMVAALKEEFDQTLIEENFTMEQIYKAFKLTAPAEVNAENAAVKLINQSLHLTTSRYKTILDINKQEWDRMYKGRGAFDWNALALLENIFSGNALPEDNWEFDYIVVRDAAQHPVAASFVTTTLWKDDMMSPAAISAKIEELRKADPYYLVSRITSSGSLITEGEHIYVDRKAEKWKDALVSLLDSINEVHVEKESSGVILRDFTEKDNDLIAVVAENGYFRASMPDNHVAANMEWDTPDDFFNTLTKKGKMHFRTDVRRYYNDFEFVKQDGASPEKLDSWYKMYLEVRKRNIDINTFALPQRFFEMISQNADWEVNTLVHSSAGKEVAVVFSYLSGTTYAPTVIGMNYDYVNSHKIYKQTLFRLLERAKQLGCKEVHMGFGASLEKRKLNCKPVPTYSLIQTVDTFSAEFLNNYTTITTTKQA
jgi:7-keto-8-aminopelargonate synthetase-like enzyme/predicted N-acyltransferase